MPIQPFAIVNPQRTARRARMGLGLAVAVLAFLTVASSAMAAPTASSSAASVEVLNGTVRPLAHSAKGRAAVIATGSRRTLTLRNFRIDPGPRVRVWLVPRGASGDRRFARDHIDLGRLKGSRGNQSYTIPARVDLRRYSSVIFWCVPFTQGLARADLKRS